MRRVGALLVEVALGADVVGDAPGDARGAADHDGGHAGVGRSRRRRSCRRGGPPRTSTRRRRRRCGDRWRPWAARSPRATRRPPSCCCPARPRGQPTTRADRLDAARRRRVAAGRQDALVVRLALEEGVVERPLAEGAAGQLGDRDHREADGQVVAELAEDRQGIERRPRARARSRGGRTRSGRRSREPSTTAVTPALKASSSSRVSAGVSAHSASASCRKPIVRATVSSSSAVGAEHLRQGPRRPSGGASRAGTGGPPPSRSRRRRRGPGRARRRPAGRPSGRAGSRPGPRRAPGGRRRRPGRARRTRRPTTRRTRPASSRRPRTRARWARRRRAGGGDLLTPCVMACSVRAGGVPGAAGSARGRGCERRPPSRRRPSGGAGRRRARGAAPGTRRPPPG